MSSDVAIVGMACRYPDARTPSELWDNALAQRRAFRKMPECRLRLDEYPLLRRPRGKEIEVGVIADWVFDRLRFRVAGDTYRATDPVHWLALETAADALTDAGFPDGRGLPRESTGVVVGNTLTGEVSRANTIGLRWPYVRRIVAEELAAESWSEAEREDFFARLETRFMAPFAPVNENTLAGGLSNTIAGQISNQFEFQGCAHTIDGACASSLLAVSTSATALAAGELDAAVVGGVDLSLDPFELVGFAAAGALAEGEMVVYDRSSRGFWPGEGCGFVVLMRHEDALTEKRRIYAVIRGCGISADGRGGSTRPVSAGQQLAIERAYVRAGFAASSVGYLEGHGTGTAVGDETELRTLRRVREGAGEGPPAVVGSIKANVGHTKAAAGICGLIKATLAVSEQVLPPTTASRRAHDVIADGEVLRTAREAEIWPADRPLRAGVSAMGFGGVNVHVVIENPTMERRKELTARERTLSGSPQDCELLLLDGEDTAALRRRVDGLLPRVATASIAELGDLAAELSRTLAGGSYRAAVVGRGRYEIEEGLARLRQSLEGDATRTIDPLPGVFVGHGETEPRLGFLFPGQSAPLHLGGGAWRRRFPEAREIYERARLPETGDELSTDVAQPAIAAHCLAALAVLRRLGVEATAAAGHSLGELAALHWAGAFGGEALLDLARTRGEIMASAGDPAGRMLAVSGDLPKVEWLAAETGVVVACWNAPGQSVVSGHDDQICEFARRASAEALRVTELPVSRAFHSPWMTGAVEPFEALVGKRSFRPLARPVFSTVTGARLEAGEDLANLLARQLTEPVRFTEALASLAAECDLILEVGPGTVLAGLAGERAGSPVLSLDAGGDSLAGLMRAVGALFAAGTPLRTQALFEDRFSKEVPQDSGDRFLVNPCEAELPAAGARPLPARGGADTRSMTRSGVALNVFMELVAHRAELPAASLSPESHLLDDLHLNSIAVGQLVAEACRLLDRRTPRSLTEFADATVAEVASAIEALAERGEEALASSDPGRPPAGIDSWIRVFRTERIERDLRRRPAPVTESRWSVLCAPGEPLAAELEEAFTTVSGRGVLLVLPALDGEAHAELLLEAVRVLDEEAAERFLLVHRGAGASFARTLHIERELPVTVVEIPGDPPTDVVTWIVAEAMSAEGYGEARYDAAGGRSVAVLAPHDLPEAPTSSVIGGDDHVLVTGGGKGIAAECALELARATGCRLTLWGRSARADDPYLEANLERFEEIGSPVLYQSVDVTDRASVRRALGECQALGGPVTAFVHAAGVNEPKPIGALTAADVESTMAPKVGGAENVLGEVDPAALRVLVTFGSIIGRLGFHGEAHYALANEILARLTLDWREAHPACHCLCMEWSVWSGVGMGESLGTVDGFAAQGITAITPEDGALIFRRLLQDGAPTGSTVIASRFGTPTTIELARPELPLLRFLERPIVHYPGVEIIAEFSLTQDSDPYLGDHRLDGDSLFPAVLGLEAMVQAATALVGAGLPTGGAEGFVLEDVRFAHPIVVPEGGTSVRVVALRRGREVRVALRAQQTGFAVDHFEARVVFGARSEPFDATPEIEGSADRASSPILAREDSALYGALLFQRGRFRRVRGYRRLEARACEAEIEVKDGERWFGSYLPGRLLLGDPGARDAAMHAIQACIPHRRVLPVSVDRIERAAPVRVDRLSLGAVERAEENGILVYDLELLAEGRVVERWHGLHLARIEEAMAMENLDLDLLAPYLERRIGELTALDTNVKVAVVNGSGDREVRRHEALRQLFTGTRDYTRRRDGRPDPIHGRGLSISHSRDVTMAVAASRARVGCDVEVVSARTPETWADMLREDRAALAALVASTLGERLDAAATRVWTAIECLRKADAAPDAPLLFGESHADGWASLDAGRFRVLTYVGSCRGLESPVVTSVLIGDRDALL